MPAGELNSELQHRRRGTVAIATTCVALILIHTFKIVANELNIYEIDALNFSTQEYKLTLIFILNILCSDNIIRCTSHMPVISCSVYPLNCILPIVSLNLRLKILFVKYKLFNIPSHRSCILLS